MSYGSGPTPYGEQPPYGGQPPYGAPNQFGQFGAPALTPDVAPLPGASFGQAAKRYFQRYAQFRGYASQSEFWWAFLLYQVIIPIVIYVVALVIGGLAGAGAASAGSSEGAAASVLAATGLIAVLLLVYSLVIIVPSIAVMVRRLHDTGKSGLFVLFYLIGLGIVPLVLCCFESRPDLYRPEWS
ncbi:DUF805 domain-containing protein [Actinomyces sp. ZJ308]|uniref:DUF805 domain-containing protein n=1 Tax=Actinomyces sp. ZJ308 TaxID=2708342 RepID=UPI00141E3DE7|nr:DUF805 domain-containing protein [Actinomyces sp. ZJ308]